MGPAVSPLNLIKQSTEGWVWGWESIECKTRAQRLSSDCLVAIHQHPCPPSHLPLPNCVPEAVSEDEGNYVLVSMPGNPENLLTTPGSE